MSGGIFSVKSKKNEKEFHSFLQIVAFVKKSGFFFSETKTSPGRNFLVYTCFVCVCVCVGLCFHTRARVYHNRKKHTSKFMNQYEYK